jgi:hypothetical protein
MTSIIKVDTIQDQDGNNIINENANTITIGASGDTITIPAGATLANNGTATGFASIAWQSSIVTAATLSAVSGNGYWINTTSNACTITLPASAAVGDTIVFVDYARTWGTNAVTINQNSLNFQGATTPNPIYNTDGQSVTIVYSGATQGWIPTVDDAVTDEVIPPYSVDFLVVAGGGGAGDSTVSPLYSSGAGGAGGYRTSTQTVNGGTVITVTVGDGGTGATSGSNSSISGSGLTTITSAGGGVGGNSNASSSAAGTNGGSGGGGGGNSINGAGGTGNTPSTSPSQGNNGGTGTDSGNTSGGGGGGATSTGGNGVSATGGNGGNGTASSITGSSVTYAGGGGGGGGYDNSGSYLSGTGGTGGTGGGGNGSGTSYGSNGTVNLGGGAGGSQGNRLPTPSGGKGVVILSVPTANYSATSTGSPTITTSGANTILSFTGSGSYTA